MMASGSPIGVSTAPSPIEKHAIIIILTLCFLVIGSALTISTNSNAAIIAVITLDKNPNIIITKRQIP